MSDRDDKKYDGRRIAVDYVTCELMIEAMRAIQRIESLDELRERVPVTLTRDDDTERETSVTLSTLARSMRRILLDPRRFICAMDQASQRPDWWAANFIHCFNPEMGYKEIGAHLKINSSSVRDYIHAVEIPDSCYDNLPPLPETDPVITHPLKNDMFTD